MAGHAGPVADGARNGETAILLGLLSAVERDSRITQRGLSSGLGIALGLANAYLRRCVRKGLVKMCQVPLNRYAYYLTPHGFAEKSRLTAEYLAASFDFFREARLHGTELFDRCAAQGWRRVVLVGAGDLAEIAILSAGEASVAVVCVVDPAVATAGRPCAGRPVVPDLDAAFTLAAPDGIDAVVVTDLRAPQQTFERLCADIGRFGLTPERVLAPELLRISCRPLQDGAVHDAHGAVHGGNGLPSRP